MRFSTTAILSLTASFIGFASSSQPQERAAAVDVTSTSTSEQQKEHLKDLLQKFRYLQLHQEDGRGEETRKKRKELKKEIKNLLPSAAGAGYFDVEKILNGILENNDDISTNVTQDDQAGGSRWRHLRYSDEGIIVNPNIRNDVKGTSSDVKPKATGHQENHSVVLEQPAADAGILSIGIAASHDKTTTSAVNKRKSHEETTRFLENLACKGADSCIPYDTACNFPTKNVEIEDGSCNGHRACLFTAFTYGPDVEISCYSCNGSNACVYLATEAEASGSFTVKNSCGSGDTTASCSRLAYSAGANANINLFSSCNEYRSCENIGRRCHDNLNVSIDSSCNSYKACSHLGEYADGSTFAIHDSSCTGEGKECDYIGQFATGARFQIDGDSCTGIQACDFIGRTANIGSSIHVESGTCHGEYACFASFGRFAPENAYIEVGSEACLGYCACCYLGRYAQNVYIGEGSCVGSSACYVYLSYDNENTLPIHIGKGSCTCDYCCFNLQPGSYIGDGLCVSGDEQCGYQEGPVVRPGKFTEISSSSPQASRDAITNLITDTIVLHQEASTCDIKDIFVNVNLSNTANSDELRVFLTHVLPGEDEEGAPQVELFSATNFMCGGSDPAWETPSISAKFFLEQTFTLEGLVVVPSPTESEPCPGTDPIEGDIAVADLSSLIGRNSSGEWILTIQGVEAEVILTSWEIGIACAPFACAARQTTTCGFSDNPNEQFTSFCVQRNDNQIFTECVRHNIGDEISEIGRGMHLPSNLLVLGCGCCDSEESTAGGVAANGVGNADVSFCFSEPICTPKDGNGWDPCDTIGDGKIRGINVCVDGNTECLNPFHMFTNEESVTCGVCPE